MAITRRDLVANPTSSGMPGAPPLRRGLHEIVASLIGWAADHHDEIRDHRDRATAVRPELLVAASESDSFVIPRRHQWRLLTRARRALTALRDAALAPRRQAPVPRSVHGDPQFAPNALAERIWAIHSEHRPFRTTVAWGNTATTARRAHLHPHHPSYAVSAGLAQPVVPNLFASDRGRRPITSATLDRVSLPTAAASSVAADRSGLQACIYHHNQNGGFTWGQGRKTGQAQPTGPDLLFLWT